MSETFWAGILSGLGGALSAGLPMLLALKKQKDGHTEAMAKIQAERDVAVAKIEEEGEDKAFARLEAICVKLEKRVETLEESNEQCEKNYKELAEKYETLEEKYDELKKEYDELVKKG